MAEVELVKAWNGKWHLFEADLAPAPAIPKRVLTCDGTTMRWPQERSILPRPRREEPCRRLRPKGTWERTEPRCYVCEAGGSVVLNPKPQPERQVALTQCGQEVLVRQKATLSEWNGRQGRSRVCDHCAPIIKRRSNA